MSVIVLLAGASIMESVYECIEWLIQKRYNKTHTKRRRRF